MKFLLNADDLDARERGEAVLNTRGKVRVKSADGLWVASDGSAVPSSEVCDGKPLLLTLEHVGDDKLRLVTASAVLDRVDRLSPECLNADDLAAADFAACWRKHHPGWV